MHFCAVFPCQICIGLHEIYSYVLLIKREGKSSFVAFLWTETKSRSVTTQKNQMSKDQMLLHLGLYYI